MPHGHIVSSSDEGCPKTNWWSWRFTPLAAITAWMAWLSVLWSQPTSVPWISSFGSSRGTHLYRQHQDKQRVFERPYLQRIQSPSFTNGRQGHYISEGTPSAGGNPAQDSSEGGICLKRCKWTTEDRSKIKYSGPALPFYWQSNDATFLSI